MGTAMVMNSERRGTVNERLILNLCRKGHGEAGYVADLGIVVAVGIAQI